MYFAVMKLRLEDTGGGQKDLREFSAFAEKIRSRFKVSAMVYEDQTVAIAVAALHPVEAELSRKLDNIIEFCESEGLARVESEEALLDHIDAISDFHD